MQTRSPLSEKSCIPCRGGVPPLPEADKQQLLQQLRPTWALTHDNKRLRLELRLKDFASALQLANKIGELAEREWHHPTLTVGFGQLDIEIYTHKISDLVESDFILAAKIETLLD